MPATRRKIFFPFLGAELGGSHVATFALADALRDGLGQTPVFVGCAGSKVEAEVQARNFEFVPTTERPAARNMPWQDALRFAARAKLLRRHAAKHDVLHCNDIGALQAWAPAAKLAGLPVVYHHHSLNRSVVANRLVIGWADAVVCVSDACVENLGFVRRAPLTKVMNPFADVAVDRETARKDLLGAIGAQPDARLIGFIGNFWRRKRPLLFLDACAALAAEDERSRFVVFGRAGDFAKEDLRQHAAALGIAEKVFFLGFRSPPENNVAALDLLLATAEREPFGRTLVEAALVGTPYLATDDAGHHEIHAQWGGGKLLSRDASASTWASSALMIVDRKWNVSLNAREKSTLANAVSAGAQARRMMDVYDALPA